MKRQRGHVAPEDDKERYVGWCGCCDERLETPDGAVVRAEQKEQMSTPPESMA